MDDAPRDVARHNLLRYMALLQKAVNNQVDMITIELDDVEMFCKKDPSFLGALVNPQAAQSAE